MSARSSIHLLLAVIFAVALISPAFAGHTPPDPKGAIDPWDHTEGEGNGDPDGASPPDKVSGGIIILFWWGPGGKLYSVSLTSTQIAPTSAPSKAIRLSRVNR